LVGRRRRRRRRRERKKTTAILWRSHGRIADEGIKKEIVVSWYSYCRRLCLVAS